MLKASNTNMKSKPNTKTSMQNKSVGWIWWLVSEKTNDLTQFHWSVLIIFALSHNRLLLSLFLCVGCSRNTIALAVLGLFFLFFWHILCIIENVAGSRRKRCSWLDSLSFLCRIWSPAKLPHPWRDRPPDPLKSPAGRNPVQGWLTPH